MSSASRKIKRAQRQNGSSVQAELATALRSLNPAMESLQGFEELPEILDNLKAATAKAERIAEKAENEYEELLQRISDLEEGSAILKKKYETLAADYAELAQAVGIGVP